MENFSSLFSLAFIISFWQSEEKSEGYLSCAEVLLAPCTLILTLGKFLFYCFFTFLYALMSFYCKSFTKRMTATTTTTTTRVRENFLHFLASLTNRHIQLRSRLCLKFLSLSRFPRSFVSVDKKILTRNLIGEKITLNDDCRYCCCCLPACLNDEPY
jgi:hypothetical protein